MLLWVGAQVVGLAASQQQLWQQQQLSQPTGLLTYRILQQQLLSCSAT
jgi:hypothetical protein